MYIDFLLRLLIIKCVCYSPDLVSFKTFRNFVLSGSYSMVFCECPCPVVFHQLEKSTKEITEQIRNVAKQAPTRTPKHSQMGLWEGPGRIFSSSRFSTALRIPCGIVFGAFWGALGTMSAVRVETERTVIANLYGNCLQRPERS